MYLPTMLARTSIFRPLKWGFKFRRARNYSPFSPVLVNLNVSQWKPLGVWCFLVPVCQRWRHKQQGIWNSCSLRCRCHAGKPCFLKKQVIVKDQGKNEKWVRCLGIGEVEIHIYIYIDIHIYIIYICSLLRYSTNRTEDPWMVFGVKTYKSAETDLIQCIPKPKRIVFFWAPQLTSGCKLKLLIRASWNRLMPPYVMWLITTGNPEP